VLCRHIFLTREGEKVIHPQNAEQIERMTGVCEHKLPQEVKDEYMQQLRMWHRTKSSGGALPAEMVIAILRSHGIGCPTEAEREKQQVVWSSVPNNTKVLVSHAGNVRNGVFCGVVAGGSLSVRLDDEMKVLEFRAGDVRLDKSIPSEIKQDTMKNDTDDPKPVKAKEEPEVPEHWDKADYVLVDGDKIGLLVGENPKNPREYTVEIDGEFVNVDKGLVADASA